MSMVCSKCVIERKVKIETVIGRIVLINRTTLVDKKKNITKKSKSCGC